MYINVSWSALNGTPVSVIEGEILAVVEDLRTFVDYFFPYEGVFLASIKRNETPIQIQRLSNELSEPGRAPERYSFIITLSPNGQPMWLSEDMASDPAFAKLEEYVT